MRLHLVHFLGLQVNMVREYNLYYFSHNKFWIVDGKRVNVCTGIFVDGLTQKHAWTPHLNMLLTTDVDSGNWAPTDFPGPPHRYSHALFSPERTLQLQCLLILPIPAHNFCVAQLSSLWRLQLAQNQPRFHFASGRPAHCAPLPSGNDRG